MKKLLFSLTVVGALLFAVGLTASAAVPVTPAVTKVEPSSGFNDIDTSVTITGTDFAVDASGAPPTVRLNDTPLTGATWVDTQTLTATVPWGVDVGTYDLTVTNPDGGEADTLPAAFTVKPGLGNWNAGVLNGAGVAQLLMQPPGGATPDATRSLYALAYDVGLFRSDNAGASWQFTSANVIGNADFVLDPHYPDRLYSAATDGLRVSNDKGQTWQLLLDTSGDAGFTKGDPFSSEVFVSPNTSDTLFFAIYGDGAYQGYKGLRWSKDAGKTWHIVPSLVGTAVQNVAFDPTPGSHKMVLATSDARVFTSTGSNPDSWTPAASSPPVTSLGYRGYLAYNPYYAEHPGEVWLSSTETSGGIFRSNADTTHWTDVSQSPGHGYKPTFVGPDDVYIWESHSTNDGSTWEPFGPWPTWGTGEYVFDPDDTRTVYFTNYTVGVRKSTDGGAYWNDSNQGLSGMLCNAMSVAPDNPLRVYASFNGWGGVYITDDGTNSWAYHAIDGSGQMFDVLQDPFDSHLVYAVGSGLYKSTDGGTTWPGTPWVLHDNETGNQLLPPGSPDGLIAPLAADPYRQGHLLVADRVSASSAHDNDTGLLFSSDDGGTTWTSVVVTGTVDTTIGPISDIEFDPSPEASGTVYLTSDGSGVFRSHDHGATWTRIDDPHQRMLKAASITIATHPLHELAVLADNNLYRSPADGAPHWQDPGSSLANAGIAIRNYSFVDHDSTRLYAPTWGGLYFSSGLGDSWARAAGALGGVQVTTLADAVLDGHTILYAATTGGDAGAVWHTTPAAASAKVSASTKTGTSQVSAVSTPVSSLVGAGIYRRAQVTTTKTFYSSGSQDGWVLESRHGSKKGSTMSASASTVRLGDTKSKQQYRSILSFGTGAGLPDGAVITGVTLVIKKQSVAGGGNPVSTFRGFMADIRNGYFGTSSKLQASDFQASANKSYGAFKPAAVGNWYSIDLTSAKGYVNKLSAHSGLTQLRLRFSLDHNNNKIANYLSACSGNASAAYRPRLVVTYYEP
jgi:hypothetical protein